MTSNEQRFLDHLGVTAWHAAGYTGKRGLTASAEQVDGSGGSHANMTKKVFQLFAPDRELVYLSCASMTSAEGRTSKFVDEGIPIIKARQVDTMWKSLDCSSSGAFYDPYLEDVKDYFTFFAAAANDAEESYNRDLESKWIYGVGAYNLMSDGTMSPTYYSSISEYVDFATPTLVYGFSGTSCACPVLCGMAAVVNDFFIDKTGKPLSSEKMYQFLKDSSVDIYEEGKDIKTGWGAPILPPPDEVDIQKYAGGNFMVYEDDAKISEWHKDDVYRAYQLGLMTGDGVKFDPQNPVTREQLATTLVRLYDTLKK